MVLAETLSIEPREESAKHILGEQAVTEGAAVGLDLLSEYGRETGRNLQLDATVAERLGISREVVIPELVTSPIAYRGFNVRLHGGIRSESGQRLVGVVAIEPVDSEGMRGGLEYATGFENGIAQRTVLARNGQAITNSEWQIGAGMMMQEIAFQCSLRRPDLPYGTVYGVRKG